MEALVHADFDGGEVVVSATECKACGKDAWVGCGELREDRVWREHGWRRLRGREGGGNVDFLKGFADGREVGVGGEAGAGAMSGPLMFDQACRGKQVGERVGVSGARRVGTVLWVGAV